MKWLVLRCRGRQERVKRFKTLERWRNKEITGAKKTESKASSRESFYICDGRPPPSTMLPSAVLFTGP